MATNEKSILIERRSETADAPLWRLLVVAALFLTTGATGLIYEVLWTRQLIYTFGATIYAVSTVLAAFMGGLALGSWLFGGVADRLAGSRGRLFVLYGALEALVGLAAFALPWLIDGLDVFFGAVYKNFEANFTVFSLIRFVCIFAVLLIPTTIMGGTLPILSKYLARRPDRIGGRVGTLYALNTFGAVVGCFLSGFLLIEWLGLSRTNLLAVGLNVAVAVVAILVGRSDRAEAAQPAAEPDEAQTLAERLYPDWVPTAVLWSYAVSGAVALAYQVLWARGMVFAMEIMKNTTYAFTAMLTVFLIGLALGSAFMTRIVDRQNDPLRLYGLIQVLIGLSGALSLYVILNRARGLEIVNFLDFEHERVYWIGAVINTFYRAFAGVFLPTLLMGMAFPVAARLYVNDVRKVGGEVGRLYAMNTIGAIVGSFLGGFVIIPVVGLAGGVMMLALVNVAIGALFLVGNPSSPRPTRWAFGVVCAAVVVAMIARFPGRHHPFQKVDPAVETLEFYEEGPLATVSVVRNNLTLHKTILVDNVGVAGTDPILLTDQKSLAHFPVLFHPDPKSALTVGFGSGGASHSYCVYDFMDRVRCIEICKTVLKAAPFLKTSNRGIIAYESPDAAPTDYVVREDARGRYGILIDDVRSYLNFTGDTYDIIATDCTDLDYKSSANLYDLEYFQLCRDRIADDGLVVVWMPLGGLSDEAFRCALRTLYRVFPEHMSVWYMNNEPTHYVLLIAAKRPPKIDVAAMRERLADPRARGDLAEIGLADPIKIVSTYVCDQRTLEAYLAGDLLNTEDKPYLEFEAPRYGFGSQPLLDNLERLWEIANDVEPYLVNWAGETDPKAADLLRRYREAVGPILKGHHAYRKLDIEEAARQYMKAHEICPEDKSVERLLNFEELTIMARNRPDLFRCASLGRALFVQGRYDEAFDWLREAVAFDPERMSGDSAVPRRYHDLAVTTLRKCKEKLGIAEQ